MMTKKRNTALWSLKGAAVVVQGDAPAMVRTAGGELARYLYLLTGEVSRVTATPPPRGVAVALDARMAARAGVGVSGETVGSQGYRLAAVRQGTRRTVYIAAASPVGFLYGVYGLLEKLGMGFYAGGDSFPDLPSAAEVPENLDETDRPAFQVRGNMLHYNFLCGCTDWGLADYKFYFDQLARMRCNLLLMHWYDDEPGAAYHWRGEYRTGGVTPNSLTRPWGAVDSLRTSQFPFDAGRFFDEEIYSSPAGEDLPDLLTEIKRTEILFAEATRYARQVGVEIAAGFEAPREDPTDPGVEARFRARMEQFLARNPDITRFALWQHESGGCVGTPPPAAGTAGARLLDQQRAEFAYLGNEQRVWEAIRFGRFAEIAHDVLVRTAPRRRLVLVGWGGDRWMQFADYCLAYDKRLPADVAFTCHDNIDASMGPNVSTPWGQLPPARERWAMPWVEGDIDECASRQPNVESLGRLVPDALRKGCQGLLTLQWRTRDVEEETGYIAQVAWDTALTPDRFYRRFARQAFGAALEGRMGRHVRALQRLGSHWTGVRGTVECGGMSWCGWVPHFPFEVTAQAASYLIPKAEAVAEALAEVPRAADGEAAFHLLPRSGRVDALASDRSRPGVAEMRAVAARLQALESESGEERLRQAFREIEEQVYALRPKLVAFGMTSRSYQAVDTFLLAIHFLQRSAGATKRMALVRRIRRDLDRTAQPVRREGRLDRLERLDYLAATMDFLLAYDAVAMRLAEGEPGANKLAEAAACKERGDAAAAAALAAEVYTAVVEAGMQRAVEALTAKLTTRCDFGTLTTFCVKQMGLYRQTMEKLEALLPAAPPRDVRARGRLGEVWLSWTPGSRAASQNLYRRAAGARAWKRVNREPLAGGCKMFVDTVAAAGTHEYAVSAVDGAGWESPLSHPARATVGRLKQGPRLVACKPFSRLAAGEDLPVRVVALSDRDIARVAVRWRMVGDKAWKEAPLVKRFRQSYAGVIHGEALRAGTVEYLVEAVDGDGNRAAWPASAPRLPWSATVTPPGGRKNRKTSFAAWLLLWAFLAAGGTADGASAPAPGSARWEPLPRLPVARHDLQLVAADGRLYAVSGAHEQTIADVERYDATKNAWTNVAPIPEPRGWFGAAAIDGRIYCVGGKRIRSGEEQKADGRAGHYQYRASLNIYDPGADRWSAGPPMRAARAGLAAAGLDGKLYAVGGSEPTNGLLSRVEIYDPEARTWQDGPPLPDGREDHVAAATGGKLYVIGGVAHTLRADVFIFDPRTNGWTTGAPMPTPRRSFAVAVDGPRIWCIAGIGERGYTNVVEIYDTRAGQWSTGPVYPGARAWLGAATLDGVLHTAGGADDRSPTQPYHWLADGWRLRLTGP
jgi:N-acetylneuraminic acid mutarotase